MTIQCKNLDEIIEVCDVSKALNLQCGVEIAKVVVRLQKGPFGTQIALIRLSMSDLALKVARRNVGWSVCPLSIHQLPKACFRYL